MNANDYRKFLEVYLIIMKQMTPPAIESYTNEYNEYDGCVLFDDKYYLDGYNKDDIDRIFNTHRYYTRIAYLRVAEHIFNFFLNQFPEDQISEIFGKNHEDWWNLKNKRDSVADTLAALIESDFSTKLRFEEFCENLKNPRNLGCML